MLRKYKELTGCMEVMEENMKEVKVKSLKKRNQVRQLKEENQKKTAQIKELLACGRWSTIMAHALVSDHADMQKAEQLVERNVKENAWVIGTIDDGYECDDRESQETR
jgi:hypothetical protein